jgi:NAD(P)-dependent dehydrogenase (short-subunit alcohol dehydrogenase family)
MPAKGADVGRLESKIAIVTGAARGIGYGIAQRFVSEGARVIVADILGDQAKVAAASITGSGEAVGHELDVADEEQVTALFAFVDDRYGRIDVLVNNAGIVDLGPVLQKEAAEFDRVVAVNLRGAFLCSREAARRMAAEGGGAIVNIASISSLLSDDYTPAYAASKGGIDALTRGFAVPLGAQGVRVNAIAPGIIETRMSAQQLRPDLRADATSHVPLGRLGQPEDIANAALFLASEESQWITGARLVVDGGTSCRFAPRFAYELPDVAS